MISAAEKRKSGEWQRRMSKNFAYRGMFFILGDLAGTALGGAHVISDLCDIPVETVHHYNAFALLAAFLATTALVANTERLNMRLYGVWGAKTYEELEAQKS